MSKDKEQRQNVNLGFQGGGGLALRLLPADAKALLDALSGGDWHEVEDADGPVRVNLSQVVYVRAEREDHRVGFGLS